MTLHFAYSSGMTCPAADFVDESFLQCVKDALSDKGLFIINLVSRSQDIKDAVISRMKLVRRKLMCYFSLGQPCISCAYLCLETLFTSLERKLNATSTFCRFYLGFFCCYTFCNFNGLAFFVSLYFGFSQPINDWN